MKNLSYARLTEITEELLRSFTEESAQAHDSDDKRRRHLWAAAAFLRWHRVSCELCSPSDVGLQADTSRFELLLAGQLELPLPPPLWRKTQSETQKNR
jgi:hypothetical protein